MGLKCIRLVDAVCDPHFYGYRWEIIDRPALAGVMARLALGDYRYVAKILAGLDAKGLPPASEALKKRVEYIRNPGKSVDNRDGWLFQMIAWVAAFHADPKVMISPPHQQPAFKGFDSLLLRVDGDPPVVRGVVIGEDKATKNARKMITARVWPEIEIFERGSRDDELVSSVTTLLERFYGPEQVDAHIEAAFWKNDGRAFRVCMASHDFQDDDAGRRELFGGFADVAPGDRARRRAETLFTAGDVRTWMNQLAGEVADALEKLGAEVRHVR